MQLLVTRPAAQAHAAVRELRHVGVDAVALPLIVIEGLGAGALAAEEGSKAADEAAAALNRCWATLAERRLVMFVSANAVVHFFAAAAPGAGWPGATLAGSTGPGTTAALLAAGVPAGCVVQPPPDAPRLDSEALWQQLRHLPWQGQGVLIVRGDGGRDWLAQTLRAAGARVERIAAYRRKLPVLGAGEAALLAAAGADPGAFAWHFGSGEAARNLLQLAPGGGWRASPAFATHPRIADSVRSIGFAQVQVLAPGVEPMRQAWSELRARAGSLKGPSIQSRPQ